MHFTQLRLLSLLLAVAVTRHAVLASSSASSPAGATAAATMYDCPAGDAVDRYLEPSSPTGDHMELGMARLHGATSMASPDAVPCALIATGWWHYELCWNRFVRQFHVEEHRITAEYFLGLGPLAVSPTDRVMLRMSR